MSNIDDNDPRLPGQVAKILRGETVVIVANLNAAALIELRKCTAGEAADQFKETPFQQ